MKSTSASMFVAENPGTPDVPASLAAPAAPRVRAFHGEEQRRQGRGERLDQIEQARRLDVARAKAVLAARRCIDAAGAELERGPNFAVYDLENHAWAIVAEDPDPRVLAVEHKEAQEHLRSADAEREDTGLGGAPRARALQAGYELAVSLGAVLATLQGKDPRDADDLMSDVRARLSSDGGTAEGARRAFWRAVARYRRARAARRAVAGLGSDPSSARNERSGGMRERPREGG